MSTAPPTDPITMAIWTGVSVVLFAPEPEDGALEVMEDTSVDIVDEAMGNKARKKEWGGKLTDQKDGSRNIFIIGDIMDCTAISYSVLSTSL
jgi:hypothetical protein